MGGASMADRLRIGILGAAGIAKLALMPAIRNSHNAEIAGVAWRNAPALADWARTEGILGRRWSLAGLANVDQGI